MTRPRRVARHADVYCAAAAAALVAVAFLVPRILSERARGHLYAGAAPIFGNWLPHVGWGTVPAIVLAALVVRYGPDLAHRLPWRRALLLTWLTATAWAFALAMVDGWQRGFAGRLTTGDEYLHEVGGVRDIPAMLRGFSARILDFQPDSWTTHVSGHPPGALLTFVLLDRIGLRGGAWAALLCVLVGCSAAAAVPVAIRALGTPKSAARLGNFSGIGSGADHSAIGSDSAGSDNGKGKGNVARRSTAEGDPGRNNSSNAAGRGSTIGNSALEILLGRSGEREQVESAEIDGAAKEFASGAESRARAAMPFLALAPAVIWIAVSADAFFAGVTVWAVALLAIATRQRPQWVLAALAAGVLFGFGMFLSYGLVLMAVPAVAVLVARTLRPAVPALVGVLLVVVAFKVAGFWWVDGYHLVVQRYYQGIASERPYSYWVWANLAATVCAVGLAPMAAVHRVVRGLRLSTLRGRPAQQPWALPESRPSITTISVSDAGAATPAAIQSAENATVSVTLTAERTVDAALSKSAYATAPTMQAAANATATPQPVAPRASVILRAIWDGVVPAIRRWQAEVDPVALLACAGLLAVLLADLSGLSKAETERIWLPFDVWVLAGAALLPARGVRAWLAVQAVGALVLVHFILTNW
ncbi:MAG: hypothetical protein JWN03_5939 [Nocardia sp.]|nr:hypothetical protein [Nocardia sp.]